MYLSTCRCIHLLSELSKVDRCRSNVALLLPLLAETTGHRQYIQHCNHMETLMKQVRERKRRPCDYYFYVASCYSKVTRQESVQAAYWIIFWWNILWNCMSCVYYTCMLTICHMADFFQSTVKDGFIWLCSISYCTDWSNDNERENRTI